VCKDIARLDRPQIIREEEGLYPFTLVTVDKVSPTLNLAISNRLGCCRVHVKHCLMRCFCSCRMCSAAARARICCAGPPRLIGEVASLARVLLNGAWTTRRCCVVNGIHELHVTLSACTLKCTHSSPSCRLRPLQSFTNDIHIQSCISPGAAVEIQVIKNMHCSYCSFVVVTWCSPFHAIVMSALCNQTPVYEHVF
jgi:hypothetical protein